MGKIFSSVALLALALTWQPASLAQTPVKPPAQSTQTQSTPAQSPAPKIAPPVDAPVVKPVAKPITVLPNGQSVTPKDASGLPHALPPKAAPVPMVSPAPKYAPPSIRQKPATPVKEKFWPFAAKLTDDGRELQIEGEIDFAAIKPFREAIENSPNLERIVMNSPGGIVVAAELMAQTVRKRGLKTHVSELCTSACTLIFLSGTERTMDAEALIGFHQASTRGFGDNGAQKKTDAFDSLLAKFYLKTGLSKSFVDRILATPFDDMMLPTTAELVAEKVLTSAPK